MVLRLKIFKHSCKQRWCFFPRIFRFPHLFRLIQICPATVFHPVFSHPGVREHNGEERPLGGSKESCVL